MPLSLSTLNEILANADIEGLISDGAPADEYSSEAKEIYEALNSLASEEVTEENIIVIVTSIFAQSFERDTEEMKLRVPYIISAAREILKMKQKS